MAKKMNFPVRIDKRRAEAKERNEKWAKLTNKQKLDSLEKRGHGHCKQATAIRATVNP